MIEFSHEPTQRDATKILTTKLRVRIRSYSLSDDCNCTRSEQQDFIDRSVALVAVNLRHMPLKSTPTSIVLGTLHRTAMLYFGCIDGMNKRFRFGDEVVKSIKEFGQWLKTWDA